MRADRRRPSVPDLLFLGAVVVAIAAQVAVVATGFFLTRMWEDEAYNLTVPINLVAGLGYTSDGILTSGQLDTFDIRISTGPTVLLPIAGLIALGVDSLIAGRIIGALYYTVLLAVLALIGRRIAGRWGALLAALIPLTLNSLPYPSPLQGPTDVLGEVPAAAFLALFLLLFRRHPLVAALMLGLAVQSKTLAVVAFPAALLGVFLASREGTLVRRALRAVLAGAIAVAPTALFELVKLITLGPGAYRQSTRALYEFLRSGGQTGFSVTVGEKLVKLSESWFLPGIVVALLVAAAVAVVVATVVLGRRGAVPRVERGEWVLVGTAAGILATWLGWWTMSSGQPLWIRHPSPALLSTLPVLAVWVVARAARVAESRSRLLVGAVAAVVFACLAVQIPARIVAAYTPAETLAQQRAFADEVSELPGDTLRGDWGELPSISVLAGKRAVLLHNDPDGNDPVLLERVWGEDAVERAREEWCGPTLAIAERYLVCAAG